jgi:hypothetical protein
MAVFRGGDVGVGRADQTVEVVTAEFTASSAQPGMCA